MAPCVAAGLQWTLVEICELGHVFGGLGARNLRAALRISHLGGHRRRALADANDGILENVLAPGPTPSMLVELVNVVVGEAVCRADGGATLAVANRRRGTRAVLVWLGTEVGHVAGGAADVLAGLQLGAEALL